MYKARLGSEFRILPRTGSDRILIHEPSRIKVVALFFDQFPRPLYILYQGCGAGAGPFWPNWSRSREIVTAPAPDQVNVNYVESM